MKLLFPNITDKKFTLQKKFNDIFLIYKENDNRPFAYRAPHADNSRWSFDGSEILYEFDRFTLIQNGRDMLFRYSRKPSLTACLSPMSGYELSDRIEADRFRNYLATAYNLDPQTFPRASAISAYEELISKVADFCGCLTDIYRENYGNGRFSLFPDYKTSGGFIAVSLPIISLMYRRISVLRGFNFKLSFAESFPCLGFSAKVLLDNGKNSLYDIPEYAVLSEIADGDSLIIAARLVKIGEEDGDEIHKLSVVICPQDIDPRGMLRAPELIKRKRSIIDKFDFDIPGRF